MTRLAVLLRGYSGPLEADLEQFYSRDLVDFHRGRITLRKLGVLVAQLPPGARIWTVLGSDAAWTVEAHLLRRVNNAVSPEYVASPAEQVHEQGREAQAAARTEERIRAWEQREAARQAQLEEASDG